MASSEKEKPSNVWWAGRVCYVHREEARVAGPDFGSCNPKNCKIMENHAEEFAMMDAIEGLSADLAASIHSGEDTTCGSHLGTVLAIRQLAVALHSYHRNPCGTSEDETVLTEAEIVQIEAVRS